MQAASAVVSVLLVLFGGKNLDGWIPIAGEWEVRDGAMAGEVTYYPDEVSALTCTSDEHGWSLVAR